MDGPPPTTRHHPRLPGPAWAALGGLCLALLASPLLATPTGGVPPSDPPANPAATGMLVRPPGTPLYNWLSASLPTLLIVAGSVVVITVLLARSKAAKAPKLPSLEERFARLAAERERGEADSGPAKSAPRPAPGSARASASVAPARSLAPDEALDAVIRDTEELAQRLAAVMDARAARLETLIREADDRLRRLEAARAGHPEPVEGHVREPRRAEPARAPSLAAATVSRAPAPSFDAEPDDPVHRQVFDLADQGLPALDIARRLGQPTGQVELILALRGR